ncbi:MAG: VanZ family protein [Treponema sp.]|jgi:VanZ family protein|nr:VanZ family protein [Treponema sp.]
MFKNLKNPSSLLLKLPAPLIAGLIWVLSSQSSLPQPEGVFGLDKAEHFLAYAVLAAAAGLWIAPASRRRRAWGRFFLIAGIAAAYGLIDEVHQAFVPGRDCGVWDWIADALGSVAGAALIRALAPCLDKKPQAMER